MNHKWHPVTKIESSTGYFYRFERASDKNDKTDRVDWMGSVWIRDRINANHLDNRKGTTVKDVEDLSLQDMIPTKKEKDYVFRSLISYFSYRLVQRHPKMYKSINKSIRPNRVHQYQEAMDSKTEEVTGTLFTKSESRTEDLIEMMQQVQSNIHTYEDDDGKARCYERKIVSGDSKTEKNMHYAIQR